MKDMFSPVVRTKVGARYMISSQSVSLTGENPEMEIYLDDWSCMIRFLEDEGKSRYKVNIVQGKLFLDLYNHKSTKGEFIYSPIKIAKSAKWQIYLTYWTKVHIGSSTGARKFDYHIWVEESV